MSSKVEEYINNKPLNGKVLMFDFDGVIHGYQSGWKGVSQTPDPPVPGIAEKLEVLQAMGASIVVVSSRCSQVDPYNGVSGITAVRDYLNEWGVPYDEVQAEKPAMCYLSIDDRGLRFDGNDSLEDFIDKIVHFRTWMQKDSGDYSNLATAAGNEQAVSMGARIVADIMKGHQDACNAPEVRAGTTTGFSTGYKAPLSHIIGREPADKI